MNTDFNICKIFKPLYIYLRFFGLFPYSFTFIENKQQFKLIKKSIYFNALCAISNNMVIYTFSIVAIQDVITAVEGGFFLGALLSRLNYIFEMCSLLLVCNVIYLCIFINRHKYLKILNGISSAWLDFPIDIRSNILKKAYIQMYYVVITLFICMLLQFFVNLARSDSWWKIILVTLSFIYPQMVQMTTLAFHHILNVMLASTLTGINELIQKFDIHKNNVVLTIISVDGTAKVLPLEQIESVYCKISQLVKDVNEIFRAIILVTLFQCFHSMTSESYFIYMGFVTSTHTLFTLVNCSLWIGYQLMKIISVSYTGNLLKDEVCCIAYHYNKHHTNRIFYFLTYKKLTSFFKYDYFFGPGRIVLL